MTNSSKDAVNQWLPPERLPPPKSMEEVHNMPNRIVDTMAGQVILITGATGFLGKVLLEKILRMCDIDTVYLLIRSKKGKDPRQRIEEMYNSPLFFKIKEKMDNATFLRKVIGIAGDVAEPNLGLSAENRKLLEDRVTIVYHAAATIRFDEPLKKAILINTLGTKLMLQLAKGMKKLKVFMHVSTAYCHLKERVLYEKLYPPPANPHHIIKCIEWLDEEIVTSITDKILGDLPNTYAYTKALSESLVAEQIDNLPVVILRPSIVVPIWKEPLPGWTDNLNGPTGLLIGAGKGVIRTMFCNQDSYADYLPVDVAVSSVLLATWNFIGNNERQKCVYHLTSSSELRVTWAELIERGRRIVTEKLPLNGVVWYPGGSMKKSRLAHNIAIFFFHLLPALLIDGLIFLSGNKPIMMRVQRRINKGFEVFEYYTNKQWDFKNEYVVKFRKVLNDRERLEFPIEGNDFDIDQYILNCIRAARLYILKETPETIPAARRHMKVMYCVDVITKILLAGLLLWTFVSWSEGFLNMMHGMFNL